MYFLFATIQNVIFLLLQTLIIRALFIEKVKWGEVIDLDQRKAVFRYTLRNQDLQVHLTSYGAAIVTIVTPDRYGHLDDIVLGFDSLNGYLQPENAHLGATVGRVANRIANGTFSIHQNDRTIYYLDKNDGNNTLHGGFRGFSKVVWEECDLNRKVSFCYVSPNGEGGFPGSVFASVTYTLNDENELHIQFQAKLIDDTQWTPINMANHAYFNLAGHKSGPGELYKHIVSINANCFTPVDENSIPTGEINKVEGTVYDLRTEKLLGTAIMETRDASGFDINYVLRDTRSNIQQHSLFIAAIVGHPPSGRRLTVYTNQPGMQFYTSNSLNNLPGKDRAIYQKHSAFCVETQHFPDSVHHTNFPSTLINSQGFYSYNTVYKMDVFS